MGSDPSGRPASVLDGPAPADPVGSDSVPSDADPDGPAPDEAPPGRPWVRRVLLGMAAGVVVVAVIPLAVAYPYLRDDYVLEGVVRAVALDWRDFGRDKAQARLEYELDRRGVGMWVGDDDCALVEEGDVRRVTCAWRAEVRVPFADAIVPLAFRSSAGIDGTGALVP